MKLSEIKSLLNTIDHVKFQLENRTSVPEHCHVTEIGVISKHFIDCGGIVRNEKVVNFQLWDANDLDHHLKPSKLLKIIALSEKVLGIEDLDIEVEYQTETIGRYDLSFDGENFVLNSKLTSCLAKENCGNEKQKIATTCCGSEANCC